MAFFDKLKGQFDESDESYFTADDEELYDEAEEAEEEENTPKRSKFFSKRQRKNDMMPEMEMAAPAQEEEEELSFTKSVPFSKQSSRVLGLHAEEEQEVCVQSFASLADAMSIAPNFRAGKVTVINFEEARDESEVRRALDFLGGVSFAMDGKFKPIGGRVYLFVPKNVKLTGDLQEQINQTVGQPSEY